MSRKFKINPYYYDDTFKLYNKKTVTIKEGLTVLVGCNGAGKSTLLQQIKQQLEQDKIPVLMFDNLFEGGSHARQSAGFYGDYQFLAQSMGSSEGENIILNIGKLASSLRPFIQTGKAQNNDISQAFIKAMWSNEKPSDTPTPNERWLLLDAVDSGLSIDNVLDIKEQLFTTILNDNPSCTIYIVVSANEYEMANGEQCLDTYHGKYIQFKNYEEYRQFIIDNRKIKDKRFD